MTDELELGELQETDEASEMGLQLADELLQAGTQVTAKLEPGGSQAATEQEPEEPQVNVEPKSGGLMMTQGVGWVGGTPSCSGVAQVVSPSVGHRETRSWPGSTSEWWGRRHSSRSHRGS